MKDDWDNVSMLIIPVNDVTENDTWWSSQQGLLVRGTSNVELFLRNTILDPIKPHVHWLGSLLFDLFVSKSVGGWVVNLDWGGWLGVSHFCQGVAKMLEKISGKSDLESM
jgi:hypothetical protein